MANIAPGEYLAKVMSTRLETADNAKQTPFIVVRFQTNGGGEIEGWFCLSEASLPYTIEKLDNLGWTGDNIEELDNSDTLVGSVCSIVVGEEEYNGKMRSKVKFVNRFREQHSPDESAKAGVNDYLKKLRSGAFKKKKKDDDEDEPAFH